MDKTKIHKMWIADQGDGTYINPILYTDYSDPDAIRVGEDYFMIASSFCNTPAVPLLHSKDLVNWKVINYIIDKLPFDYYDKPVHGCGTWAPAIRYHEGTYYVFIPMPDEGIRVDRLRLIDDLLIDSDRLLQLAGRLQYRFLHLQLIQITIDL